jgi:hypothetical protein
MTPVLVPSKKLHAATTYCKHKVIYRNYFFILFLVLETANDVSSGTATKYITQKCRPSRNNYECFAQNEIGDGCRKNKSIYTDRVISSLRVKF